MWYDTAAAIGQESAVTRATATTIAQSCSRKGSLLGKLLAGYVKAF
jgi:hypothetical protein